MQLSCYTHNLIYASNDIGPQMKKPPERRNQASQTSPSQNPPEKRNVRMTIRVPMPRIKAKFQVRYSSWSILGTLDTQNNLFVCSEGELEALDTSNIIEGGRRTRGRKIDFKQFGADPEDEEE